MHLLWFNFVLDQCDFFSFILYSLPVSTLPYTKTMEIKIESRIKLKCNVCTSSRRTMMLMGWILFGGVNI